MGDWKMCPRCGISHYRREVDPCAVCMSDYWAIDLGISIRRFLRRAEVEELVSVIGGYSDHSQFCDWRHLYGVCSCGYDAHARPALSRLAALAMEGHGDG